MMMMMVCDDDDDDDDGDVVVVVHDDDDTDDEPQYPDVFSGGSTPESARERQREPESGFPCQAPKMYFPRSKTYRFYIKTKPLIFY